ncbi:MAG: BrnT family toxin [Corallincola sp.]|nr:BrnT family toxin [Corallincola sp.]
MDYEWDENKRTSNLEKHGVDFVAAVEVFKDKDRIETEDTRKDYGEVRLQSIGEARPGVLFVVYTLRDKGSTRRLISARKANLKERAIYLSLKGK